jgi:hypothetical protein
VTRTALSIVAFAALSTMALGCSKDEPPPQQPQQPQPYAGGYQQQPGGYPQQQPGAYPQQQPGGYPQQQPGMAPTGGQMATPGPLALPCQNDSGCGTHRCNTQFGKCAYPCQTDTDCIQGSTCFAAAGALATCIPKTQ